MTIQTAHQSAFLKRPGFTERGLVIVMVLVFSLSLPTEWFITRQDAAATGGPLVQLTFLGFAGVAILGINGNWPLFWKATAQEPLIAAFLGWALLSTLWSEQPPTTFTTVVVLLITYLVAVYLKLRFSLQDILLLAGLGLAIAVFINFVMIFGFPASGLQRADGDGGGTINDAWSGVFRSRNSLGRLAVISYLIFCFNARIRRSLFIWPSLALMCVVQVLGTGSATALGSLMAISALSVVLLAFRGRKHLYGAAAVAMFTVFSVVTAAAAVNLSAATALVGRDATFTGRLPLWIHSIEQGVVNRPWSGHGYGAFWTGGGADFEVLIRTNFAAPHSHNAFLDAWLNIGPVGSILLMAIYVRGIVWGTRNIRRDKSVLGLFPAAFISLSLLFSLSETGFFAGRTSAFVLLIITLFVAAENKGVQRPFDVPVAAIDPEQLERDVQYAL